MDVMRGSQVLSSTASRSVRLAVGSSAAASRCLVSSTSALRPSSLEAERAVGCTSTSVAFTRRGSGLPDRSFASSAQQLAAPSSSTTSPSASAAINPSHGPIQILHPPSHLASYFYPAHLRGHYLTLQSLFLELANVPSTVSSELLGRIRYGWWRDAIRAAFRGQGGRFKHPIIIALQECVQELERQRGPQGGLVLEHFEAIVDEWENCLAQSPTAPTLEALERHSERLYSRQFYLHLNLLNISSPPIDEVFSHLGKSIGLLESIISLPSRMGVKLTARSNATSEESSTQPGGRIAKNRTIPLSEQPDRLGLPLPIEYLSEFSVSQEAIKREGGQAAGLRDAVFKTATRANDYLLTIRRDIAQLQGSKIPAVAKPALVQGTVIPFWLSRLQKWDFDPFQPGWRMEAKGVGWRLPLRMWRTNWTGKL